MCKVCLYMAIIGKNAAMVLLLGSSSQLITLLTTEPNYLLPSNLANGI